MTAQNRLQTAAGWTSLNPVLTLGQIGFETDTRKHKIGDGTTAWTSLGYGASPLPSMTLAELNTAISDADVVSVGGPDIITGVKTFTGTEGLLVNDNVLVLRDNGDITKRATFDLGAISAGQTRNIFIPDTTGTMVFRSDTATLTNKTLTAPVINAATVGVGATLTAGTDAQGQAPLTSDFNRFTTTAANPSGATLPTGTTGRRVTVANDGTNPINLYPATGAQIDALGSNAPISIAVGVVMDFLCFSTLVWRHK